MIARGILLDLLNFVDNKLSKLNIYLLMQLDNFFTLV